MRNISSGILLLVCWLLAGAAGADISANVPLGHWGYDFLDRCAIQGLANGLAGGIRPYSRMAMAQALVEIGRQDRENEKMTRIDRQQLALLIEEFAAECVFLKEGETADRVAGRKTWEWPGRVSYRHEQGAAVGELLFRQQTDSFSGWGREERESIFRTRLGATVRGQLRNRLGFYISFEQSLENGSRTYAPPSDPDLDLRRYRYDVFEPRLESIQLKGSRVDFHEGKASLIFALPFGRVEFGKGDVVWGPAPGDNLGLSNNAPSFDMLRLDAELGIFRLVSIAGSVRPCPDRPDSPACIGLSDPQRSYIANRVSRLIDREKYLAAHRLEVSPTPWFSLGLQEVLVYGDRGPQLTYLNPLMFYWAAQSYLGDKDNVMMGIDFALHPGTGWRLYLAYVFDDLKKKKIFSDDFSNKFSLQTGVQWVNPLGFEDLDLWAEYVRIEPWVYTHRIPINTFRHFDSPLGHALGPNSDRWQIQGTRRLSRDLSLRAELSRTRHGDNELLDDGTIRNVGGDLHLGSRPAEDDRQRKAFLDGQVSRRTRLDGAVRWRILAHLHLDAGYAWEWGDQVPLPPRWGDQVPLTARTGYGSGRQQHLHVDLRYHYF